MHLHDQQERNHKLHLVGVECEVALHVSPRIHTHWKCSFELADVIINERRFNYFLFFSVRQFSYWQERAWKSHKNTLLILKSPMCFSPLPNPINVFLSPPSWPHWTLLTIPLQSYPFIGLYFLLLWHFWQCFIITTSYKCFSSHTFTILFLALYFLL